jgi:hypothetical protein
VNLFDYERPYIAQGAMRTFRAIDPEVASRYGFLVKAADLSNREYGIRFNRFARENNMKPPPSAGRIFAGYLVVRRLGTKDQYETWMPYQVFEDAYEPAV